jgi:hypothetical protein
MGHVGLKLTIDWHRYSLQVELWGETVSVNKTIFVEDNLAPEVLNGIIVFNQAVMEQRLKTDWRVAYPKDLDRERINRELGFVPSLPLTWVGKIRKQDFPVAEFPELTVTFYEAVPEEVRAESPESLPEKDDEKGLFDRIKDAFG